LKEDFSVLIVGGSGSKIRSLPAPRFFLAFFTALILIGIGSLVSVSVGLLKVQSDRSQLERLAAENRILRRELHDLDDQIAELEERWQKNTELEDRMRLQANLPEVADETRMMGVGGPSLITRTPLEDFDRVLANNVLSIKERTEQLIRQCDYQRSSYLQIIEAISEQQKAWDRMPSIAPLREGYITSGFGRRLDPFTKRPGFHKGVDFSARRGTPVFATADGRVAFTGRKNGYGLTIEIDHGNGIETVYAHNLDSLVKRGQRVTRGQIIARVGNSGRSTAPHLHYEIRINGKAVNPLKYILPEEVVVD